MPSDSFQRLFAYDAWGNAATLESIRLATFAPSSRACAILAHLIGAGQTWLGRLQGRPSKLEVWPALTLDQCAAGFRELEAGWTAYLATLGPGDADRKISYVNSRGETWESTIGDILMHVALHGTYHRGQIAMLVRESGNAPAYTDFIEATRRGVVA